MSTSSSALTIAVGAGGGLAAWYLLRERKSSSDIQGTSADANASAPTPRSCALRLDQDGLVADGVRVGVPTAIKQCKAAGRADMTVLAGAPVATYSELMVGLHRAGIPTYTHRNARAPRRNVQRHSTFTLVVYPQGDRGPKRIRWFRADSPTTWDDARDRLAAAHLIDLGAKSPHLAGAWRLVTDPRAFDESRAMLLPGGTRDAARSIRYTLDGRTIHRDGEAVFHLQRVDLGDERYAISPHAADVLAQKIVDLLNGRTRGHRG